MDRNMVIVKSKQVQLSAFSLPGHKLPTFSKGTLKTVFLKFWFIKIPIRRYLLFTEIVIIPGLESMDYGILPATTCVYDRVLYQKNYSRIK